MKKREVNMKRILILLFVILFPVLSYSKNKEYPMLGITLGFPAGWNFIGGYMFQDYGFFLSGMYRSDNLSGGQINIMKKIYDKNDIIQGISLIGGREYISKSLKDELAIDWTYGGVVYNFYAYNWFFEVGAKYSVGDEEGDFINFYKYLAFQIGYVFAFN